MSGPTDFAEYISAEKAYELHNKEEGFVQLSLKAWKRRARNTNMCEVCEQLPVWRYGGSGMCFPCTTGESDASEDYELIQE